MEEREQDKNMDNMQERDPKERAESLQEEMFHEIYELKKNQSLLFAQTEKTKKVSLFATFVVIANAVIAIASNILTAIFCKCIPDCVSVVLVMFNFLIIVLSTVVTLGTKFRES